jgi:hypothetical protein
MIVALAGRRIDSADAELSRFPLRNAGRVREDLHNLLVRLKPLALVSSAACGADLLALDEAGALGIRRRVILPFDPEQFLETSVIDRPGEWRSTYERVIAEVTAASDLLIVSKEIGGDESYSLASSVILDQSSDLSKYFGLPVTAVVVWDGRSRGPDDLTAGFRTDAERRGFEINEILTN